MYNVQQVIYPDACEYRIYSRMYGDSSKKRCVNREFVENPFDGELAERLYDIDSFVSSEDRKKRSQMVSRKRAISNVYELARCNMWAWFVTITFDGMQIDRYDYLACSSALSRWLNKLRHRDSELRYIVVPELHRDGAYHFHGLFSDSSALMMVNSGHVTGNQVVYNIASYTLGFTTATRVKNSEAVTKYITKYITKDLIDSIKGHKHFWASRNLSRPEKLESLLDASQKDILSAELEPACKKFKYVEYNAGSPQSVRYYEVNNDGE